MAPMGSCDPQQASAILMSTLYRKWGLMTMCGQAFFKLAGLSHVRVAVHGAQALCNASAAAHVAHREAYQLHFAAVRGARSN